MRDSRNVGLSLQIEEKTGLVLQKTTAIGHKSIKKEFNQIIETDILTSENTRYESGQICFSDGFRLIPLDQAQITWR